MLNKFVAVGRLTKDVALRYTRNNVAVVTGTIAIRRNRKEKTGEYASDFLNIVVWGASAENFANWTKKGTLISIDGELRTRNYENQQGQRVYVTEVLVDKWDNLSPRDSQVGNTAVSNTTQGTDPFGNAAVSNTTQGTNPFGNAAVSNTTQGTTPFGNATTMDIDDDDLPF